MLPEMIEGSGALLLRRWAATDVERLERAILESLEHLRPWMPWMPWIAQEPMAPQRRMGMICRGRTIGSRGDGYLGVCLSQQWRVAAGCTVG